MASDPRSPPESNPSQQLSLVDANATNVATSNAEEDVSLSGTVERVVFHNPNNAWTVARLIVNDPKTGAPAADPVSMVGVLSDLYEGMPVRVWGRWETHAQYGKQLRVRQFQPSLPETLVGLERYLGSRHFARVGPELARRVVRHFGHDTAAVLESAAERLTEVDGIGPARAKSIAKAWNEQRDRREVKIFLHSYGVTDAYADRIFQRYGNDTMRAIRENPYRLAFDIWGIGFRKADDIARNLGIEASAPERLEAGLVHVLEQLGEDGHVHAPEHHLFATAAELLAVDKALLPERLDALEHSGLVVRENLGDRGPCVSLNALWQAEEQAANALCDILSTTMRPLDVDLDKAIARFEHDAGIQLAPAQKHAIQAALLDKCVVITGGPGVGKTTIIRGIVDIMIGKGRRLALAAPTGRAAKRLSESTGENAVTLHRLLEYQPHHNSFQRGPQNPLEADAVIVDEVSMVDILLFQSLLAAMPPFAQLILVGDVDQLPSVGPGSVLADVIASDQATVVRLSEIFRQAARSRIITAAHEVNRGQVPSLEPPPGRDASRSDFYFIQRDDPVVARETIVNLVAERIPERFGFSAMRDIQVLCPMHRGELGTRALNQALQERLNPAPQGGIQISRGERHYRVGDRIMQIKNDYDKSVFNGDVGLIQDITGEDKKLVVDFMDGRVVVFKRDDLDKLTHAYAVSVHKSQGSEYPAVVLAISTHHYMMLQRNLLYTALTRGKKLVILIGSPRAVAMATHNQSTAKRWTWLAERVRAGAQMDERSL